MEAQRAASLPAESLDSWSAYHRGLRHMYRFNAHDNAIAARLFDRAVTADPGFARAHAGLSFTRFQSAFVGYARDRDAERRRAREHAEAALALDALDPFVTLTMGRVALLDGDLDTSLSWFERCVELNPGYAFAIYNRALAEAVAGDGVASEAGVATAMALSPIDPMRYAMLATRALSHIVRGDWLAASDWADRGARAPNAHVHVRAIAAIAHELAGRLTAAEAWAAQVRRSDPDYGTTAMLAAFPFRDARTRAKATAALRRLKLD